MKKIILFLMIYGFGLVQAQLPDRKPGEWFSTTGFEAIFSFGNVNNIDSIQPKNVVRFSLFFDFAWNANYDFNPVLGFYTGWDVRNIGFINTFNVPGLAGGGVTLKQRCYDIGIPLALKVGNLKKDNYLAFGGEMEFMFAFKQKVLWNGYKDVNYVWGSSYANPVNPSIFAELHNQHGGYIRVKFYSKDFLKNEYMGFAIAGTNQFVNFQPSSSKLFYVSIGTAIRSKRLRNRHADKNDV